MTKVAPDFTLQCTLQCITLAESTIIAVMSSISIIMQDNILRLTLPQPGVIIFRLFKYSFSSPKILDIKENLNFDRNFIFCPLETLENHSLGILHSSHRAQKQYRIQHLSVRDFFPILDPSPTRSGSNPKRKVSTPEQLFPPTCSRALFWAQVSSYILT